MSLLLFSNNASTTLAAGISSSATSVSVASGTGAEFPAPSGGQYFRATFVKNGNPNIFEIVKVTGVATDTFTIIRAQETTTALAWAVGDFFNLFPTAGDLADLVQKDDLQGQSGNYAIDTGPANAYAVVLTPALTAHVTGMPIRWKAGHASTAACTFNDGVGAASLNLQDGTAVPAGAINAGGIYTSIWNGSAFELAGAGYATQGFATTAANTAAGTAQTNSETFASAADVVVLNTAETYAANAAAAAQNNAETYALAQAAAAEAAAVATAENFAQNGSNITLGSISAARLPEIGALTGITIAADPGTVPSGVHGQMWFYY